MGRSVPQQYGQLYQRWEPKEEFSFLSSSDVQVLGGSRVHVPADASCVSRNELLFKRPWVWCSCDRNGIMAIEVSVQKKSVVLPSRQQTSLEGEIVSFVSDFLPLVDKEM